MTDLRWTAQFPESKKGRVEIVAQHVLIDHVLDFACEPADWWLTMDRLHIDRQVLLELIPRLACISKAWNIAIRSRVEYAALRAASSLNKSRFWNSHWLRRRGSNPLAEFDSAFYIFSRSWSIDKPIPMKLRTTALGDLSNAELCSLFTLLRSGWMVAVKVTPGDGQELVENIWVTPAKRVQKL
ncbi:hypothetical protein M758_UG271800 [Ceratodon purpureus]|nr:hypothetical protein M758_UG271800 [Ceratodon purpureus]